jgi:hypothetical protein
MSREEFKRGFIKQCQAEGLTTEGQILSRVSQLINAVPEKRAAVADLINSLKNNMLNPPAPSGKDGKGEGGGSPWPATLAISTVLPFGVGAAGGALASKLKGNWLDEEDVQQQELIDELRRQTQLARQYQRIGGTTPSSF